jgi:hypothetical protein
VLDRDEIEMDLVMLLGTVGHQIDRPGVDWTAALASAPAGQSLRITAPLRSPAYPFALESM